MRKHNYLNLSLRSIFHLFVSGSLFYFCQQRFHISLPFGIIGAFLTGLINEIFEDVRKIDNSFHTRYVFERDRILAALSIIFTAVIVQLHLFLTTLFAPLSLLALTYYMDKKTISGKLGRRNLLKAITDVTALTLGPVAYVVLLKHIT